MTKSQSAGRWCSEAEVRKIIGPAGAATLVDIISGGWQAYIDEGRARTRRARACIVWEGMIERADRDLLGSFDGVRKVDLPESAGYVLCERILLRFKKHDGRCGPPTSAQWCSASSTGRAISMTCRIWRT